MKLIVCKFSFLFCFLVLVSSCKKDPVDDLKGKMVGEWKYEKLVWKNYSYTGTLIDESSYAMVKGEYYNFKQDGSAIQYLDRISNNNFRVTAENRFELNTGVVNPCRVESIGKNTFVFTVEGPRRDQYDYVEYTHYLKR
jgi:hypothetical protein